MQRSESSLAGGERDRGSDTHIRQPCQSRMATVPKIIASTVSNQKNAVQGQYQSASWDTFRPKYIPGGHVLHHMVKVGRENLKKPLEYSNYPSTSYNISNDGSLLGETRNTMSGHGKTPADHGNPRYDWQITLDKLHGHEKAPPQGNYRTVVGDPTHSIPRFGVSELRGTNTRDANVPVAKFNLADEYRTNTSRGFKFVRGAVQSSPSSNVPSSFGRTLSSGTNGNTRIGTFRRGEAMVLPESSMTDFATRDLTESWNKFPFKNEPYCGSGSGLMPTATMGASVNNF